MAPKPRAVVFLTLSLMLLSPGPGAFELLAASQKPEESVPHEELTLLVRHPVRVEQRGSGPTATVTASYPGRPPGCTSGPPPEGEVVIRTDEEYDRMIRAIYARQHKIFQEAMAQSPGAYAQFPRYTLEEFIQECNHFPPLDFDQQTLLGKWIPLLGLPATVTVSVRQRPSEQRLICAFRLTDAPGPRNEMYLAATWKWLLVPRVPPQTSVSFEVTDDRTGL